MDTVGYRFGLMEISTHLWLIICLISSRTLDRAVGQTRTMSDMYVSSNFLIKPNETNEMIEENSGH